MKKVTDLCYADPITADHAQRFVERWFEDTHRSGALFDALGESEVLEWPDPGRDGTPLQERYNEVAEQILDRMYEVLREPVADAFLSAAQEVLGCQRERELEGSEDGPE